MRGNKHNMALRKKKAPFPEEKDKPEIMEEQLNLLPHPNRWLLLKVFGVCMSFVVVAVILFV